MSSFSARLFSAVKFKIGHDCELAVNSAVDIFKPVFVSRNRNQTIQHSDARIKLRSPEEGEYCSGRRSA